MKALCAGCLILFWAVPGVGGQDVILSFFDRPPYYYVENNRPHGFLLERAERILTMAGISYELIELPQARIQAIIAGNKERHISIGWFKNPERESISQFSLPIYRNKPQVVLVQAKRLKEFQALGTFAALSARKTYTAGALEGFSYGPYIDGFLASMGDRVDRAAVSPVRNLLKLAAGRFDFILVDQEETSALLGLAGLSTDDLAVVQFPDIPAGNLRYLWCSMLISKDEVGRINGAIKALFPEIE